MKKQWLYVVVVSFMFIALYQLLSPAVKTLPFDEKPFLAENRSAKKQKLPGMMSERKKRVKGFLKKDSPNMYAEWSTGIRTRDGESAPSYKMNYKIKEFMKAAQVSSLSELQSASFKKNAALNWVERGPSNISGRTRGIIVDPSDATHNTWFAGSVGGGVWKTTDAGQSWTEMTPEISNMATSTLAMSSANPDVIYAGTGEGFGNVDQIDGSGIWKSTDHGVTWNQLSATAENPDFQNIMRLIIDPANENIVLAATSPGFNTNGTRPTSKIFRTTDGGTNWTMVYESPSSTIEQLFVNPLRFNTQYATINSVGVIKSLDGGLTWNSISKGVAGVNRMEAAISPADTSNLFISGEGGTSGSTLFVTFNGGEQWYPCDDINENQDWLGGQGWYDNTIAAHPYADSVVYVGGIDLWRIDVKPETINKSTVTGIDFENTSSFLTFVNWGGPYAGGGLGTGLDFHGINNNLLDSDFATVEIRFGPGKSQKAHRFFYGTDWNYTYQDYVDVPFEVWDITNNRQLMISFRDWAEDGAFDLIERADPISREYLFINAVSYNANAPDPNIAQTQGMTYKNIWAMWPELPSGGTWDPNALPESVMRINYESTDYYKIATTRITNVYGGDGKNTHVDHHNITLVPMDANTGTFRFIVGNDGGVQYSDDLNGSFTTTYTGYNTSQFYGVDKMNGADRYIGGAQDNGSFLSETNPGVISTWKDLPSGDGFEALWNYKDANKMLESSQYNSVYISRDGGTSWDWLGAKIEYNNAPFFTKLAGSKQDADLVFAVGKSGVWRSDNFGDDFRLISMPPQGAPDGSWDGTSSYSQIKISLADPQVVWAGRSMLESSPLFVSTDAGLSFSAVSVYTDVSMGRLSGLETDPLDKNTAYALFSFADAPKILKTTNLGASWSDLSGFAPGKKESSTGFPNVAVLSLLVMPYNTDIIWVGTEIGLFETTDAGASWHFAANGLPAVAIYDMKIINNEVVVATHGRGIWTVELPELSGYEPPLVTLSPRISNFGGGMGGIISGLYRFPSVYDSSAIFVNGARNVAFAANATAFDSTVVINMPVDAQTEAIVQMKAYKDGREYNSPEYSVELVPLLDKKVTYLNDFETESDDFLSNGLRVTSEPGFSGKAIHSDHPYKDDMDQTILLRVPIIVAETNALLEYDDIAIVEPGESGTSFGDDEFWDYVIVEGSGDNGYSWKPLLTGYDAKWNFSWLKAYNNGTAIEPSMLKHHSINLHDTFSAYDEIVIRFRLFADANTNGWGWIIDNLQVQPSGTGINDRETVPVAFNLYQNFPNPFNPSTTIQFDVPQIADVSITIFDALGRKVSDINKKQVAPGSHKVVWNASGFASGVYFYRLSAGKFSKTKKLILMK